MAESIVNFFRDLIGNDYITVFIVSMIPFVEVRGSIPLAIAMGMNAFAAFGLAFLGSAIWCPIVLLILKPIINWLKKFKVFRAIVSAIEDGFKSKAKGVEDKANKFDASQIEKRKMLGLYAFVAFPVPMTGVWTGTCIGAFIDMNFWKVMLTVIVGDLTACIIMTLLSYFCSAYIDIILYVVMAIVFIAILYFIIRVIIKAVKQPKQPDVDQPNVDGDIASGNVEDSSNKENIDA